MREIENISHLTISDTIELRSTLHAISNQDFICSNCLSKYKNRQDAVVMTEKHTKAKGCKEIRKESIFKIRQERMVLNYKTCPGNFFSYSAMSWVNMFNHFEKGVMGFPGSYVEQPNKFIDAMSVIQSHKNEQIEIETERQKARNRSSRGR